MRIERSRVFEGKPAYFLLVLLVLGFGLARSWPGRAIDYYQFWVVGQAIRTMDLTSIYGDVDRRRMGEHFLNQAVEQGASESQINSARMRKVIDPGGTPFLYSVFSLVSTDDYAIDWCSFRVFGFLLYAAAVAFFCRASAIRGIPMLVLLLLFTGLFDPFRRDMLEGNVNQLQVAAIALMLWLRRDPTKPRRALVAAIALGLLIAFKPNVAPVFVLLLLGDVVLRSTRRALTLVAGTGLGLAIGFAFPILFLGPVCSWHAWASGAPQTLLTEKFLARSMLGLLLGVRDMWPFHLLMVSLTLVPFIAVVMGRRRRRAVGTLGAAAESSAEDSLHTDLMLVSIGLCTYLLSSPLVHYHYFTLVGPLLLFVLRPYHGSYRGLPVQERVRVLFGVLVLTLLMVRTHHVGYSGSGIYFTYFPLAYVGVALLYGWALYQLTNLAANGHASAAGAFWWSGAREASDSRR